MTDIPFDDPVLEFGTRLIEEGRRSLSGCDDEGEFSLPELLCSWDQWVSELESGALWVEDELEVACRTRDHLDEALQRTEPSPDRSLLVDFVDRVDRRFECVTVVTQSQMGHPGGWWWARVPRRTDQRLFLRSEWSRD